MVRRDEPCGAVGEDAVRSTRAEPLAGVLRDELQRVRERALEEERKLKDRGGPLTSPALEELRRHMQELRSGLNAVEGGGESTAASRTDAAT